MPVAKPKLDETTETPPRRDAGRDANVGNLDRAMTLAEAAEMLDISEAYLAYLVDGEVIPYHMVGTHRRVMLRNVLEYKRELERRNKIMDELMAMDQEMGLYPTKP